MYNILVVEDDLLLNKTLCYNLQLEGYHVDSADSIKKAMQIVSLGNKDLIILDINLTDGSGFELCKKIKAIKDTPVVFLTSNDMESDAIKGFELGAEDYVTKPFSLTVFQKKIAAILKRIERNSTDNCYNDGFLIIDFASTKVELYGKQILLTPLEIRMMKIFVENPGIVLTRTVLLDKLWDAAGNYVDEHALTSNINRLRNKIETDDKKYIKTIYGMGYMWIGDRDGKQV